MMPPTPQPPAVMARLAALAASTRPSFAATCEEIAEQFRRLAQQMYDDGDQGRGDHYTARGIAWQLAGATGNLEEVRP